MKQFHPALPTVLLTAIASASAGVGVESASSAVDSRPNVVLILADDMTDNDLNWMPQTKALIRDQGFEFTNFIAPQPLCSPSRAELLTGQYGQSNGVHTNVGRYGGGNLVHPDRNLGAWVGDAGYKTGFVGKSINNLDQPLNGWDHFNYPVGGSTYHPYRFTYSEEPEQVEGEYTADYIGRKTTDYVREFKDEGPFFILSSHVAPHAMRVNGEWKGAIPPKRYKNILPNAQPPSLDKPSFNEPDMSDKPSYLQRAPVDRERIKFLFRQRLRSLRAVDDAVGNLVHVLEDTGELDNTVVIFTSDNGSLAGEHRQQGKDYMYEEALQIPGLLRGPGIPVGSTDKVMTMVDMASTISDLTGAEPSRTQDGTSMIPIVHGASGHKRVLIQGGSGDFPWQFRGVRNSGFTYAEHHDGSVEWYDRRADPFQEQNLAGERPKKQAVLARQLDALRACKGAVCFSEMTAAS